MLLEPTGSIYILLHLRTWNISPIHLRILCFDVPWKAIPTAGSLYHTSLRSVVPIFTRPSTTILFKEILPTSSWHHMTLHLFYILYLYKVFFCPLFTYWFSFSFLAPLPDKTLSFIYHFLCVSCSQSFSSLQFSWVQSFSRVSFHISLESRKTSGKYALDSYQLKEYEFIEAEMHS